MEEEEEEEREFVSMSSWLRLQLDYQPVPGSLESSPRFQMDRKGTIEKLTCNLASPSPPPTFPPLKVETSRKWTTKSADKEATARTSENLLTSATHGAALDSDLLFKSIGWAEFHNRMGKATKKLASTSSTKFQFRICLRAQPLSFN